MEKRKKILVFHSYLAPYRIDLYNALARDFEVYVLLTASDVEKKTLGFNLNYVNEQATFKYKYVNKGLYIGRHIISTIFYKVIRDFKPDYVIAHELGLNTLMGILLKSAYKYKLFVTVDDSYSIAQNYSTSRKFLRNLVVKYADVILTVSQDVRSYLDNKYNTEKRSSTRFLYFPIIQDDLLLRDKFQSAKKRGGEILKLHRLEGKDIILFVGRLEDVKSPDLLLKAYSEMSNDSNRLVFVGEGSMGEHLKQWAKEHGLESRVIFTGRLTGDDLYAWYNIAKIFVLPSRFEPFGAVVNEALVAGCFVVVSDSAGATSLIDRTNGLVFKTNNCNHLTESLQKALKDTKDVCEEVRESKMNVSFKEMYSDLIQNLDEENQNKGNNSKMKPKALVFYTYLPPWRIDVFNEMAKFYDLTIVFLHAEAEGFTYNRELLLSQLKDVQTVFWNKGFVIQGKVFRLGIAGLLRKYKPEVVFTHEYFPTSIVLAILLKAKLFSFKLVVTTSDNLKIAQNVNPVKSLLRKFVLHASHGIVVYSETVKTWYQNQFPKIRVEVCPNIQNPQTLLLYENNFPAYIKKYQDIYELTNVILYVGRLEEVKGLDLLIRAFASSDVVKSHKLVLVGSGTQQKKLEDLVLELGLASRVVFPGQFDSTALYAWYALADIFVLPSRYEPFGAVVNEALVYGCPVLASKNIGALDYIKEGENGYIYDPENLTEFKDVLDKGIVLSNKIKEQGKRNLMKMSFEDYVKAFKDVVN